MRNVICAVICLVCLTGSAMAQVNLDSSLVGYWPLDEVIDGTTVEDMSGNALDGTVNGELTVVEDNWGTMGALDFQGPGAGACGNTSNYITLGNPDELRITEGLTISVWALPHAFNCGRFLAKHDGSTCSYSFSFEPSGEINFYISEDGTHPSGDKNSWTGMGAMDALTDLDVWYHLVAVYEPGQFRRVYVDGDPVHEVDHDSVETEIFDSEVTVEIGRRQNCCGYNGSLDELRVYDRALTDEEVIALADLDPTSIDGPSATMPEQFEIGQNYPNPFNPTTSIPFILKKQAEVSLRVYDIAGNLVQTLVNENMIAGRHVAEWDGLDAHGKSQPSGIYICKLQTPGISKSVKMMLVK